MKKVLYSMRLLLSFLALSCGKTVAEEEWLSALPKPWQLTEQELDDVLPKFMKRYPVFEDRLRALAIWRIGTPYEIFKLGEEVQPDTDPIFRLDVSDCTGHVLTSLSLAQSRSWNEARRNMIAIHYKADDKGEKRPTYVSRWHYTADRIMNHPSTPGISAELIADDALAVQSITLNKKEDGSEYLDLGWSLTTDVKYIPNDRITSGLLKRLPKIAGVAFVKPEMFKKGIISAHEGMIIDGVDLLHAGQSAGETVRQDFMTYYFREDGPRFSGIMLYVFHPLSHQSHGT